MKKLRLGKIIFGLAATAVVSGAALVSAEGADAATLYRAYNPNTGEHLYTTNGNEIPSVVSAGWKNEGNAWEVPSKGTPIYRMFNPNNGGDHHYTPNQAEVDMLKAAGWRYEGVAWQSGGSIPVHRLYNPNAKTGTHHFTIDANEKDALVKAGWRYEGVTMYSGGDQPTNPTKPTEPTKPKEPTIVSGWVGNTGKIFNTIEEADQFGDDNCAPIGSKYNRYVVIHINYSDGSKKYSVSLYND
ncbi:hypothetical protein [Candidatus Enterococcus ferrettii]|uniref:DUF5648 domain-containing protein n=1 Tax=Candidatus Enterococcus ferrettii TaxID=2815324 RepID=A0ABV0EXB0_9ENTE|nr:hypothetical protein [Enterococcus sp. 665A]MBO1340272.1 hypothetical protein [Enterococcus sp. 665A]